MANEIKAKFGSPAAMTIALASLASGSARQSTLVDNSSTRYQRVHLFFKVRTGTSPTTAKSIQFFLLKGDATHRTDGAGGSDAAIAINTADQVYAVATIATSDKDYEGTFVIESPGPEWGLAVQHDTAVALNATGGNHYLYFVGENPEVQ